MNAKQSVLLAALCLAAMSARQSAVAESSAAAVARPDCAEYDEQCVSVESVRAAEADASAASASSADTHREWDDWGSREGAERANSSADKRTARAGAARRQ